MSAMYKGRPDRQILDRRFLDPAGKIRQVRCFTVFIAFLLVASIILSMPVRSDQVFPISITGYALDDDGAPLSQGTTITAENLDDTGSTYCTIQNDIGYFACHELTASNGDRILVNVSTSGGYVNNTQFSASTGRAIYSVTIGTISRGVELSLPPDQGLLSWQVANLALFLTNTGNIPDKFLLEFQADACNAIMDRSNNTGVLAPTDTIKMNMTVSFPSGTIQGEVCMIQIQAVSVLEPSIVVFGLLTIHCLKPDVSVFAPADQGVLSGHQYVLDFEVLNSGNIDDSFAIACWSMNPEWTISCPSATILLTPLSNANVQITITVPAQALADTNAVVTLQASSNLLAKEIGQAVVGLTVLQEARLTISGTWATSGRPGSIIPIQYDIINVGNGPDTFEFTFNSNNSAWFASLDTIRVKLDPEESRAINILAIIPENALLGEWIELNMSVRSLFDGTVSKNMSSVVKTSRLVLGEITDLHPLTTVVGISKGFSFNVTNLGNSPNSFVVQAWFFDVSFGSTSLEAERTPPLLMGQSFWVNGTILVPNSIRPGNASLLLISITSDSNPRISFTSFVDVGTHVLGIDMTPAEHTLIGEPGETLSFGLEIANTGISSDSFVLDLMDPDGWGAVISSGLQTPWLLSGYAHILTINVTVPFNSLAGDDAIFQLVATSVIDPRISKTLHLHAEASLVIDVKAWMLTQAGGWPGEPGDALVIECGLQNIGNAQDSYLLEFSGEKTWEPSLTSGSLTLNIQPGELVEFDCLLSIPESGMAGDNETFWLRVSSITNPNLFRLIKVEAWVEQVVGVDIALPISNISIKYWTPLQLELSLTNDGNGQDQFDLEAEIAVGDVLGWEFYWMGGNRTKMMEPGQTISILMEIIPPEDHIRGTTSMLQVKAASVFDPTVSITIEQAMWFPPNTPPTARIFHPLEGMRFSSTSLIHLNGNLSFDPEGDPLSMEWTINSSSTPISHVGIDEVSLEPGWHELVLRVCDGLSCDTTILGIIVDPDLDGDGLGDSWDQDADGDGVDNRNDPFPMDPLEWSDMDMDGIGDNADPDDDGDGVPDVLDAFPSDPEESADIDLDKIGDNADMDDDNDGIPDLLDAFPFNPLEWRDDDGDGIGNNMDPDDDGDGIIDALAGEYTFGFWNPVFYAILIGVIIAMVLGTSFLLKRNGRKAC